MQLIGFGPGGIYNIEKNGDFTLLSPATFDSLLNSTYEYFDGKIFTINFNGIYEFVPMQNTFRMVNDSTWGGFRLISVNGNSKNAKLFCIGPTGVFQLEREVGGSGKLNHKKLNNSNWVAYQIVRFNQRILAIGRGVWEIHQDGNHSKLNGGTWIGYKVCVIQGCFIFFFFFHSRRRKRKDVCVW